MNYTSSELSLLKFMSCQLKHHRIIQPRDNTAIFTVYGTHKKFNSLVGHGLLHQHSGMVYHGNTKSFWYPTKKGLELLENLILMNQL